MSIRLFKSSEHSLDSPAATNLSENAKVSVFNTEPQSKAEDRLSPGTMYLTEGELHIGDTARPGEIFILTAGDVVFMERDTVVTYTTPSTAKGFAATYTLGSVAIEDCVKQS